MVLSKVEAECQLSLSKYISYFCLEILIEWWMSKYLFCLMASIGAHYSQLWLVEVTCDTSWANLQLKIAFNQNHQSKKGKICQKLRLKTWILICHYLVVSIFCFFHWYSMSVFQVRFKEIVCKARECLDNFEKLKGIFVKFHMKKHLSYQRSVTATE